MPHDTVCKLGLSLHSYPTLLIHFFLFLVSMPEGLKVEASSLKTSGGQTEGLVRQGAVIDMPDKLCASGTLLLFIIIPWHQFSQWT